MCCQSCGVNHSAIVNESRLFLLKVSGHPNTFHNLHKNVVHTVRLKLVRLASGQKIRALLKQKTELVSSELYRR